MDTEAVRLHARRTFSAAVNSSHYISRIELLRDAVGDFEAYPFALPAVRSLETIDLHPKVTFLVGENGSGKSTLLEAIAVKLGFNAEGGTKNFQFETRTSHSELHRYLRIARGLRKPTDGFFLRAESFFNVATEIERLDVVDSYGGVSLHEQSHGESFLALMLNRFGGDGLYILDEPEAALSPQRQLSALVRIHDLVNLNSQFIIATHSPILMAYPDAFIYSCSSRGLERVEYEETEHYRVMKQFILNPNRMLHVLFAAEDGAC
jgi:predicted ATPase